MVSTYATPSASKPFCHDFQPETLSMNIRSLPFVSVACLAATRALPGLGQGMTNLDRSTSHMQHPSL